eukprot:1783180-Pyramimonas_sp.AAC.1
MSAVLQTWYDSESLLGNSITRVPHLSSNMFGTKAKQVIKLKGAETFCLFKFFASEFLPQNRANLDRGVELAHCASYLHDFQVYLDSLSDAPSPAECRALEGMCLGHLIRLRAADIDPKPKRHLFWHFARRTAADNGDG